MVFLLARGVGMGAGESGGAGGPATLKPLGGRRRHFLPLASLFLGVLLWPMVLS